MAEEIDEKKRLNAMDDDWWVLQQFNHFGLYSAENMMDDDYCDFSQIKLAYAIMHRNGRIFHVGPMLPCKRGQV